MAVYAVYEPPKEAPDLFERTDKLAFVKEGFSSPAFFVPLLWLLFYRMWIEFGVLLLIYLALPVIFGTETHGQAVFAWVSLGIGIVFAFEANDLRAASLARRGYRLVGVASGRDRTEAERAFFTTWLPRQQMRPAIGGERNEPPRGQGEVPASAPRAEGEEVIGLFPRP